MHNTSEQASHLSTHRHGCDKGENVCDACKASLCESLSCQGRQRRQRWARALREKKREKDQSLEVSRDTL